MKAITILVLFSILLVVSGCDNPVLNPSISQAISHKMERAEYVEHTKALNRIADVLERKLNPTQE